MKDVQYLIYSVVGIIACIVLYPPAHLMITDEISYYYQSLTWTTGSSSYIISDAITGKEINLIEGYYPGGTTLLMAALHAIDINAMYLLGFLSLMISILFVSKVLRKLELSSLGFAAMLMFIPLIFISRTCMSEMPSLILVSLSLYLYYYRDKWNTAYLGIALIAGISLAFRETNLLLIAPLALVSSRNIILSAIAFVLGLSLRFSTYYWFTGDPFFVKAGSGFGLHYILSNIPIYAIVLLVLLPLSPVWIRYVHNREKKLFIFILTSFLLLHLIYGYQAYKYSGYVGGMILNGRFWIPALPFFVIALAYWIKAHDWIRSKFYIYPLLAITIVVNLLGHHYAHKQMNEHVQISQWIDEHLDSNKIVIADMEATTAMKRYIYPLINDYRWSNIKRLKPKDLNNRVQYQVLSIETNKNQRQQIRNNTIAKKLETISIGKTLNLVDEKCHPSGKCIRLYHLGG